jgi:hypothetical protein
MSELIQLAEAFKIVRAASGDRADYELRDALCRGHVRAYCSAGYGERPAVINGQVDATKVVTFEHGPGEMDKGWWHPKKAGSIEIDYEANKAKRVIGADWVDSREGVHVYADDVRRNWNA